MYRLYEMALATGTMAGKKCCHLTGLTFYHTTKTGRTN